MFGMWKESWEITDRIWNREEGAAVVEVAIIIPMIWIFIMGSILLLFFFFDMGVIRSETQRSAQEVSNDWRDGKKNSLRKQKEVLGQRIRERLILANLESCNLTISFATVTARADIRFFLGEHGLAFTDTSKVALDNREDWIRIMTWKSTGKGEEK